MAKFTFKKNPRETGLAGIGSTPSTNIKIKGKRVGEIYLPRFSDDRSFRISLSIIDPKERIGWKNIILKQKSATEQEARDFLNYNFDKLNELYTFKTFED